MIPIESYFKTYGNRNGISIVAKAAGQEHLSEAQDEAAGRACVDFSMAELLRGGVTTCMEIGGLGTYESVAPLAARLTPPPGRPKSSPLPAPRVVPSLARRAPWERRVKRVLGSPEEEQTRQG